jgi:hypothetical protein
VLDECFVDLLKGLVFDDQVYRLIVEALHENYEHDLPKKKAAGVDSSDLRPIWLPTVDNLRNFFLTPTNEMLNSLQEIFT